MVEIQNWVLHLLGESNDRYIRRLSRKRTGGDSFSAGWRYELAYNAHIVVVELANLLAAYRKTKDIRPIEDCFIDQSPTEFVDDLRVKTLTEEFLVQLKSGRINWLSVVEDFKIQRLHDKVTRRDLKYRLVNGSAKDVAYLERQLSAKGILDAKAGIFRYPESFSAYLDQNAPASSSLEQLTGSSNVLDQETAYRALVHVIIQESGKLSFVNLLRQASRRLYDFLAPLDQYDTYKDFEDLILEKIPDATARVSGRLLHLEDAGYLRTFIIPFEEPQREDLRNWLNEQEDPPLRDLTKTLNRFGWQEVDRSQYV